MHRTNFFQSSSSGAFTRLVRKETTVLRSPKLSQDRGDLFHRVTAQILFACQRGRPDLRTVVSFLTKRVRAPDEDDWKKLVRCIKYIRKTLFLRLRIEANYLDQNHWFIWRVRLLLDPLPFVSNSMELKLS